MTCIPGGGHLYFRLDIIRVKGFLKHTLNTYFSGMKIDPKYAFLLAFFLIWASCPFQNLSIWPKTYPFFQFCTFLHPNDVRAYIALSWKTTLITWIFLRGWYPTSDTSGPPGHVFWLKYLLFINWYRPLIFQSMYFLFSHSYDIKISKW